MAAIADRAFARRRYDRNGRRKSFAHAPMPRMTNTYMLAGATTRTEISASVTARASILRSIRACRASL